MPSSRSTRTSIALFLATAGLGAGLVGCSGSGESGGDDKPPAGMEQPAAPAAGDSKGDSEGGEGGEGGEG